MPVKDLLLMNKAENKYNLNFGKEYAFRIFVAAVLFFSCANASFAQDSVRIIFKHIANGKPLKKDSVYTNACGEKYSISRLQYYVTGINFSSNNSTTQANKEVFLVKAFSDTVLRVPLLSRKHKFLTFQIGVDSAMHVAGAQRGALDPLNNMYWAWNTGYVHYKMEGYSTNSKSDLARIEYHIGGFEGGNKAMQQKNIYFTGKKKKSEKLKEIIITVNLDEFWNKETGFCIAAQPVVMKPGKEAVDISRRLPLMMEVER